MIFDPPGSVVRAGIERKPPQERTTGRTDELGDHSMGTFEGAIPAKLSERLRTIVITGLAKLVDDVNQ